MKKEPDIVEELERVNVLFYIDRDAIFQKGEAVGYDPANDRVVKLGTPGSVRLGTISIYIPPEKGKPRSKPMIFVHIDNEEVFGVLK